MLEYCHSLTCTCKIQQANLRDSVLFYRDSDIAFSPDRQLEKNGAEKLQSMQQTPARELNGRLTSMVREYDQNRPALE